MYNLYIVFIGNGRQDCKQIEFSSPISSSFHDFVGGLSAELELNKSLIKTDMLTFSTTCLPQGDNKQKRYNVLNC